jgi:hypothetical protein
MPPLGPARGHDAAPDFVVGDRFGASCDSALSAARGSTTSRPPGVARHTTGPMPGGYVLDRMAGPRADCTRCRSRILPLDLSRCAAARAGSGPCGGRARAERAGAADGGRARYGRSLPQARNRRPSIPHEKPPSCTWHEVAQGSGRRYAEAHLSDRAMREAPAGPLYLVEIRGASSGWNPHPRAGGGLGYALKKRRR